ncbi:MAG: class I SAM-dependent methyltransferase, partial [Acidimicrobiia bacterium]
MAVRKNVDSDGNLDSWEKASARYQAEAAIPTDVASYGVGLPTERELRLVGSVKGKRVLDLGCGGGQASIAFARQGAHSIAIDASREQLGFARRLADREEVKVEFHEADLAELAFLPADSIDVAFSAFALAYVPDLGRVLRQVHRVLRPNGTFLFSYEHPLALCASTATPGGGGNGAAAVTRSYFDATPLQAERFGENFTLYPRTVSE